jgi:hypothetical protein
METQFDAAEAATPLPRNDEGHRANGAPRETHNNEHRDSGAGQAGRQQAFKVLAASSAEAGSPTQACVANLRQELNLPAAAAAVQRDAGNVARDGCSDGPPPPASGNVARQAPRSALATAPAAGNVASDKRASDSGRQCASIGPNTCRVA